MLNQEIFAEQVKADPFPFPCEGEISLAVRNKNYSLGPAILHLVMKPDSIIPEHIHEGVAEVLLVMQGDFINEGQQYLPGTSLHIKAGQSHGPHTTKHGCTLLVLWTDKASSQEANLDDFHTVQSAVAA